MRIVAVMLVAFAAAFAGHVVESGEDPAQAITPGNARAFAEGVMVDAASDGAGALRDAVPFAGRNRSEIRSRVDAIGG